MSVMDWSPEMKERYIDKYGRDKFKEVMDRAIRAEHDIPSRVSITAGETEVENVDLLNTTKKEVDKVKEGINSIKDKVGLTENLSDLETAVGKAEEVRKEDKGFLEGFKPLLPVIIVIIVLTYLFKKKRKKKGGK